MSTETHEFTVDKSIIIHLIKSQAGTLGKALCEAVMNSIDAGASSVDIEVASDGRTMSIVDDGHGLRTREEILAVFNNFGFDHSAHARTYGRFGLGRGQLWNWCSSSWLSHNFLLDVDVRARGLRWELHVDRPHVDGLRIDSTFYEPLSALGIADLETELERLCKYIGVTVMFNGRKIGKDAATQSWDIETDDAYVRINDTNRLAVYNQGVLVSELYRGTVGVGGVVVTKPGRALTLNMARNDINRTDCEVWKRLSVVIKKAAAERTGARANTRLTAEDRDYLAKQTVDPTYGSNFDRPIFTLTDGKHLTLAQVEGRLWSRVLTTAERGSRVAEAMMREGQVLALDAVTLARFGAASVAELRDTVVARATAASRNTYALGRAALAESIETIPGYKHLQAQKIENKDLTPEQKAFLEAARPLLEKVARVVAEHVDNGAVARRELFIGKGDMEAYTDGATYIGVVDATVNKALRMGLYGFQRIAHLMVHELLHDSDDSGSHSHDADFYEAFHEIVLDHAKPLGEAAATAFRKWSQRMERRLTRSQAIQMDTLAATPATA